MENQFKKSVGYRLPGGIGYRSNQCGGGETAFLKRYASRKNNCRKTIN
jgi:hypothetical protein